LSDSRLDNVGWWGLFGTSPAAPCCIHSHPQSTQLISISFTWCLFAPVKNRNAKIFKQFNLWTCQPQ